MDTNTIILIASGVALLTAGATFFLFTPTSAARTEEAKKRAQKILAEANRERLSIKTHILEQIERFRSSFSEYEKKAETHAARVERAINVLEERLKKREEDVKTVNQEVQGEEHEVQNINKETLRLRADTRPLLLQRTGLSEEKVKNEVVSTLEQELQQAHETRFNKIIDYTNEHSSVLAKNYLIEAINRYSAPTSVERKNLTIPINRNETKAKIMGNNCEITAFLEEQLGVDILFEDDKPGIVVAHFELVKKHIARETILKLIKDRKVDLDRAKQRLDEARRETDALLLEIGNKIVKKLNLEHRKFPNEFKSILGRLKFRTSYGQNILKHCFEVGYFTLLLGNELGLNEEVCKIGGFFHDLGKAIDQEEGRPHDVLTKEIMEKFNIFSWEEVHAAWTHHDSVPIETAEALLVKAGDAISAGRPGARQETIEKFLERVMALEKIASSYQGVKKTYAISGGRELRVLVNPKDLDDNNLSELAGEIAHEIEDNVSYPGQIKVNVIRRVQQNRTIKNKKTKS